MPRLALSRLLIVAGAAVAVVSLSLPWYAFMSDGANGETESAWTLFASADDVIGGAAVFLALVGLTPLIRSRWVAPLACAVAAGMTVYCAHFVSYIPLSFQTTMDPRAGIYVATGGYVLLALGWLIAAAARGPELVRAT
jgi:hypothetical protein